MASPSSRPPSADSSVSRHRKRRRYRLADQGKKRNKSAKSSNWRVLVAVGLLLAALLAAIVTIVLHLVPLTNGIE